MSRYIAVIKLARRSGQRAFAQRIDTLASCLRGVESVDFDRTTESVVVWFNRAVVSIGDIVRAIEDNGTRVRGVAQGPADSGRQAATA